jgi:hypothetical protein
MMAAPHPQKGYLALRIVFLEMELERRLVVARDQPKIRAVGLVSLK